MWLGSVRGLLGWRAFELCHITSKLSCHTTQIPSNSSDRLNLSFALIITIKSGRTNIQMNYENVKGFERVSPVQSKVRGTLKIKKRTWIVHCDALNLKHENSQWDARSLQMSFCGMRKSKAKAMMTTVKQWPDQLKLFQLLLCRFFFFFFFLLSLHSIESIMDEF